jgi:hypothetical protein
MTTEIKTQQDYYDIYKDEVQALAPEFTDFSEGSIHDIIAGALSIALNEVTELIVSEFSKTFFDLAEGDDLDKLAVDHFGSTFARPEASFSTGEVTFSRPNTDAGDVIVPQGTIVKTIKDSEGIEIRFETTEEVTLTGLTINADVKAIEAGIISNVQANKVTVIESALTDTSITVNNANPMAGGEEALTDAEYREWLKEKILSLAGATEAAIRGAAMAVAGVEKVSLITIERTVIDYDISNDEILAGATYFRIPYPILYIADANGNSSQALIDAVKEAILPVRACGVTIDVRGANPISINWKASLALNPSGPNYTEFQDDLTKVIDTMTDYINNKLLIGSSFDRIIANNYILSIWGTSGTNDIIDFNTSVPSGNVSVQSNEKLIAGTVEIV